MHPKETQTQDPLEERQETQPGAVLLQTEELSSNPLKGVKEALAKIEARKEKMIDLAKSRSDFLKDLADHPESPEYEEIWSGLELRAQEYKYRSIPPRRRDNRTKEEKLLEKYGIDKAEINRTNELLIEKIRIIEFNIEQSAGELNYINDSLLRKGWSKITGKKKVIEAEKEGFERDLQAAEKQLKDQKEREKELVVNAGEVMFLKRDEELFGQLTKEYLSLRQEQEEYQKAVQDILQIGSQVWESYIQDVITPLFDQPLKNQLISHQTVVAFQEFLRNIKLDSDQWIAQSETLDKDFIHFWLGNEELRLLSFRGNRLMIEIGEMCKPLFRSDIKKALIDELLSPISCQLMADQNQELKNYLESLFNEEQNSWKFKINQIFGGEFSWDRDVHDLNVWEAFKRSELIQEIFAESLAKEDREIYKKLLEKAFSADAFGVINNDLIHYPTPETIRLLVLFSEGYFWFNGSSSTGLKKLSRRGDYPQILEQAEQKYPELKELHQVLLNLEIEINNDFVDNYDVNKKVVTKLALTAFLNKDEDEKTHDLAKKILTNEVFLNVLLDKQIVSQGEIDTLLKVKEYNTFTAALRETLASIVESDEASPGDLELLKRWIDLAKAIKQNSGPQKSTFLGSDEVVEIVKRGTIKVEYLALFPEYAPLLWNDDLGNTRNFVINHGNELIKDATDIKFLNDLVGRFSKRADFLIRGYHECLTAQAITYEDKDLVMEFAGQFRVISPAILVGFKEAKRTRTEAVYLADLGSLAQKMTGAGVIIDQERARPYYQDLIKHVYPHNSGIWTSYERNAQCEDRSEDLKDFKIQPRYGIDLLSASTIGVKEGQELDKVKVEQLKEEILSVAKEAQVINFDQEKMLANLKTQVDESVQKVIQAGGLPDIDLGFLSSLEEKICLILLDATYGSKVVNQADIKKMVINFEFVSFEDIRNYIQGTTDRVTRATNQDYALLCEMDTFFGDKIKEINRKVLQKALENPKIVQLLPSYFQKLAQESYQVSKQEQLNRLQVQKLGMTDSFLTQIARILKQRNGKQYSPEQIQRLIHHYENLTHGLVESATVSQKVGTKAFYGQLKAQRERTLKAVEVVTGIKMDPLDIHLGEINLQEMLATQANIEAGEYHEEQFVSYTGQRFIDLFSEERNQIAAELEKFESESGKQREVAYGYITKSKESANARMVGGVCVSGDPDLWKMLNYLQFVLQDPETFQCQGLVLMHHFQEDGQKVLSISLNPSSTYLYSVDEAALFKGMMKSMEQFAIENNFDKIIISHNTAIRTNRTGGEFEKAMIQRINHVGKTFRFASPKQFSYSPNYQLQDMDVLWEKAV